MEAQRLFGLQVGEEHDKTARQRRAHWTCGCESYENITYCLEQVDWWQQRRRPGCVITLARAVITRSLGPTELLYGAGPGSRVPIFSVKGQTRWDAAEGPPPPSHETKAR